MNPFGTDDDDIDVTLLFKTHVQVSIFFSD